MSSPNIYHSLDSIPFTSCTHTHHFLHHIPITSCTTPTNSPGCTPYVGQPCSTDYIGHQRRGQQAPGTHIWSSSVSLETGNPEGAGLDGASDSKPLEGKVRERERGGEGKRKKGGKEI